MNIDKVFELLQNSIEDENLLIGKYANSMKTTSDSVEFENFLAFYNMHLNRRIAFESFYTKLEDSINYELENQFKEGGN